MPGTTHSQIKMTARTSAIDYNTYRWVKENGVWRIESTDENGLKTILPEGTIPARAPSRYDEVPDYAKWLKKQNFKAMRENLQQEEEQQEEVSAR